MEHMEEKTVTAKDKENALRDRVTDQYKALRLSCRELIPLGYSISICIEGQHNAFGAIVGETPLDMTKHVKA